jgi:UDP-N-acetylmuramate--alanine ligase
MPEDLHFTGIGGTGMSALAQFHAFGGGATTGSDRLLDRGELAELRVKFSALGIRLFPQDGSGITERTGRVVVSTAVEDSTPDVAKAKALGRPLVHRADFLAEQVAAHRAIAVSGTSGKSTVTAMVFEILDAAGKSPSVITGGGLRLLEGRGLLGNAARGKSDLLVIEADESDGSLVRYKPWLGLLLNIGKDHKDIPALMEIFKAFRSHCGRFAVLGDAPNLGEFRRGATTFGFSEGCSVRGTGLSLEPGRIRFRVDGVPFDLPLDGKHNALNALAAAAACLEAGVPLAASAEALKDYKGVMRRFERIGTARGVSVVDDYAHNPDKVAAALEAAKLCAPRVLAVFQPHGYGPTRFLKDDFIESFCRALRLEDRLWMPEIYYAGGTAVKDISSADLTGPIAERGRKAFFLPDRKDVAAAVAAEARAGDMVLVMGARDPSLSEYARSVLAALG